MNRMHWRRWRPQGNEYTLAASGEREDDPFVLAHQQLERVSFRGHFWKRDHSFILLKQLIEEAKAVAQHAQPDNAASTWLYALVLQAPLAAVAQESMDEHPHGYHDKEERLFELIDFNDAFVATILALAPHALPRATLEIKRLCDEACKKAGTRCFSDEQYHAIVHGLSREIAVYKGLKAEGYDVEMTNRVSDALGIDMRVRDPKSFSTVNVDIKTRSAYHYRVQELEREGRLSEEQFLMADRNGFAVTHNGQGSERTKVVIWRIDHDQLGEVIDFAFQETKLLTESMRHIMLST